MSMPAPIKNSLFGDCAPPVCLPSAICSIERYAASEVVLPASRLSGWRDH
jgi:hypothetical protein